jgi:two-component system OmpR family response regulator
MRILLVEDDAVLRDVMLRSLADAGHRVDVSTNIEDADHLWRVQPFDAVLLDLNLPATASPTSGLASGLNALRQARARGDRTPVLVLTARGRTEERIAGLDAGADDYLIKPYDPAELLARLRAVERRRSAGSSPVLQLGTLEIDLAHDRVRKDGNPVVLTQKEWALLRVMATRPERIHTRENLADALYGFGDEADSNTLEVFISRLRRKLGKNHIQTLRGLGYRLSTSSGDDE